MKANQELYVEMTLFYQKEFEAWQNEVGVDCQDVWEQDEQAGHEDGKVELVRRRPGHLSVRHSEIFKSSEKQDQTVRSQSPKFLPFN